MSPGNAHVPEGEVASDHQRTNQKINRIAIKVEMHQMNKQLDKAVAGKKQCHSFKIYFLSISFCYVEAESLPDRSTSQVKVKKSDIYAGYYHAAWFILCPTFRTSNK